MHTPGSRISLTERFPLRRKVQRSYYEPAILCRNVSKRCSPGGKLARCLQKRLVNTRRSVPWIQRSVGSIASHAVPAPIEVTMAVSPGTRRVVRERAHRRCEYCHADERWQFVRFTIDHVLPQPAGGSDDADNLALACRNCNERRGNRLEGRDPETAEVVPLFNPRRDR